MPVDPQAQVILDQIAAIDGPSLEDMAPPEARVLYAAFMSMAPVPETAAVSDVEIPVEGGSIRGRFFLPMGHDPVNPLPVLVWFHGGGWVVGDLTTSDATAAELANASGCAVVNVDYRLAPEHPFPTPLEDCYAAVQWVVDHAGDLGVDQRRLAVGGDSAGGNLAAAVCLLARELGGPEIRFQLLLYPAMDGRRSYPSYRENGDGYFLTASTMDWFWASYLGDTDPETPLASPLYAPDVGCLPSALVITAEYDPLRDEGEAYAARLSQSGVIAEVSRYEGQIHAFVGLSSFLEAGAKAIDEAAQALRAAL
jgi:acetyl esterase